MKEDSSAIPAKQKEHSMYVLGDLYTFKVTGAQTNGAFTVMEQVIRPQNGPPPHIHRKEDEFFYVLEGKFQFLCGERSEVLESGSSVYIPKHTVHTFRNIDDKPGRLLVTVSPAGLEAFFYAIGTPASEPDPGFDPSVIEKILKLAPEYEMEVLLEK